VLASALEWGEVMVVKDTVTYFGRNAAGGSSAVRDLFLPDRPMVRQQGVGWGWGMRGVGYGVLAV
jgi:hypothetical protein